MSWNQHQLHQFQYHSLLKILQKKQAHCKHSREHQTALNVNFNVSAKEALNTTVQCFQVQRKDDDNATTWEKDKELWYFDSSWTLMIWWEFQSILLSNCRFHAEE